MFGPRPVQVGLSKEEVALVQVLQREFLLYYVNTIP
jgi:hypothetical protein